MEQVVADQAKKFLFAAVEGKEELTVRTEVVEPTAGLAGAMGLSQVCTASTVPSTHRPQG